MLAILAIFLMKRKKDEKNSNLVAVNLHDRRPSSISTSKISHVTKNRDRFLAYDQSDQLTHVKLVTDTEFLKRYKLTLAILRVIIKSIMTVIAIIIKLIVLIMIIVIIMIMMMILYGIVIIASLLPFL